MLQDVRDNMKGTVAIVIVMLFVVPMVITGFGGSDFFGSVGGNDAAKVNSHSISRMELERAIINERERMKQQGVEAGSEQLKNENLYKPVLEQLTQRIAVVTQSKMAGMGVSDEQFYKAIKEAPQFQVDGKFDKETYRQQISYQNHTPTTFKKYVSEIMLVQQNYQGVNSSAFVTDAEVESMISITQQKRSFSTVELPSAEVEKTIEVSEEDIAGYYQDNQAEFIEPEKVSVDYLELTVEDLMKGISIPKEEVDNQYKQEKAAFLSQNQEAEVQIAHLMLEKKDDDSHLATIDDINKRLADGEEFALLVKEFSTDEGSRDNGGDLGVLIKGTFSEEFEQAAMALAEGEISVPVETDGGLHLIKALAKNVPSFPAIEEQSKIIEQKLKREQADSVFANLKRDLEDMTFGGQDLQSTSEALNLEIKTSGLFEKNSGTGVALHKTVRDAAWTEEVFNDGRNSSVVSITSGHAVVVSKREHVAEHVKAIELVKADIEKKIKTEKLADLMKSQAEEVIATIKSGEDVKSLSEEKGFTFNNYDLVKMYEVPVDFQVRKTAFEMPASDSVVYEIVNKANGNAVVVSLSQVVMGSREDLPKEQFDIMKRQLARQNAMSEFVAYQGKLVDESKIRYY